LPAHVTNAFRLLREVAHPLLTFPGDAGYDVEPSLCKAAAGGGTAWIRP
jgi:hypothetical protein